VPDAHGIFLIDNDFLTAWKLSSRREQKQRSMKEEPPLKEGFPVLSGLSPQPTKRCKMATINDRSAVDKIIAKNGGKDVVKIVQYNNMFDRGLAYGLVFKGQNKMIYEKSAACINPVVLWEKK
jgi:hypothetical protein